MVAHVTMADVYAQQESRAQPVTKVFKEHLVVVKLRSCAEYQKHLQFEKKDQHQYMYDEYVYFVFNQSKHHDLFLFSLE